MLSDGTQAVQQLTYLIMLLIGGISLNSDGHGSELFNERLQLALVVLASCCPLHTPALEGQQRDSQMLSDGAARWPPSAARRDCSAPQLASLR